MRRGKHQPCRMWFIDSKTPDKVRCDGWGQHAHGASARHWVDLPDGGQLIAEYGSVDHRHRPKTHSTSHDGDIHTSVTATYVEPGRWRLTDHK